MLRCDRKGKGGGGIMIYVSNLFCVVSKPEISDGFVESLWMEIHMKYNKNIIIGGVYRPPPPENEWLDYFERQMAKIRESGNHIIVAGDFNVNLLSDSNHKRNLEHLMASYNMEQLVCSPTRVTSRSSTLIDHIYVSDISYVREHCVSQLSLRDHFPVCLTWKKATKETSSGLHKTIAFRDLTVYNATSFSNECLSNLTYMILMLMNWQQGLNTIL